MPRGPAPRLPHGCGHGLKDGALLWVDGHVGLAQRAQRGSLGAQSAQPDHRHGAGTDEGVRGGALVDGPVAAGAQVAVLRFIRRRRVRTEQRDDPAKVLSGLRPQGHRPLRAPFEDDVAFRALDGFREALRPLPVRVRPRPAQTIDSYISGLARANHIRPSLLHGHISEQTIAAPKPNLDRLAALSGFPVDVLRRTLTSPAAYLIRVKPSSELADAENDQAQHFFRIQQDADGRGLTVRTLAERHQVSRRTVRQALRAPRTLPHQLTRKNVPVIAPFKHLIIPMLEERLAPSEVWDRLISDHGITLSRGPLGTFINNWHLDQVRKGHPPISSHGRLPPQSSVVPSPWLTVVLRRDDGSLSVAGFPGLSACGTMKDAPG